ncbi:unnamed protein product [marine sediment metagenome]|uniref:Uncharacterized protein n=1 Tax=marine sediment metagenome TaxID=412755 RepID=X1M5L1_9ZZZZ
MNATSGFSNSTSLEATYDGLRDLHKPTIDKLREQFKRAESSLNTDISQSSIVGEAKIEAIKSVVEHVFGVKLLEVKIAKEKELKRELTNDEEIELFENEMKKLRKNPDPQKIVSEDELQDHLAEGWEFVSVLPSRKILIRTEGEVPIKTDEIIE